MTTNISKRQLFRLKLTTLKLISAVDDPAQEHAQAVLFKRAGERADVTATVKVEKIDESLGLVFGYALVTEKDGAVYHDLHGDAIEGGDELIKIAADFMEASATSDVMHDDKPDGKIVFCMPVTPDICKALGWSSSTYGLAIAMKPSLETFGRFKSGELKAFSIAGTGERREVAKAKQEPGRARLTTDVEGHSHTIDDDSLMSGETSEAMLPDGTKHAHAWVRLLPTKTGTLGAIVIGATSEHTHTVVDPGADEATKIAAHKAELEKQLSLEKSAADIHKTATKQWLDQKLAEVGHSEARHCAYINAKVTSNAATREAANEWLAKNGGPVDETVQPAVIEKTAEKPQTFEQITKAAETRFEKAERDMSTFVSSKMTEWKVGQPEAHVRLFTKGKCTDDDRAAFSKLYEESNEARQAYHFGDVEKATKSLYEERQKCLDESNKMVEEHQLAHNIDDAHKVRDFLRKTSTKYRELIKRYSELGEEAQYVATKLKVDTQRYREKQREDAEEAAREAEEKATLEKMTVSERALFDRIGKIAQDRSVARPQATQWALMNDETAQTLYGVVQTEKRRAQGGY